MIAISRAVIVELPGQTSSEDRFWWTRDEPHLRPVDWRRNWSTLVRPNACAELRRGTTSIPVPGSPFTALAMATRLRASHTIVKPPETLIAWPVTKLAS